MTPASAALFWPAVAWVLTARVLVLARATAGLLAEAPLTLPALMLLVVMAFILRVALRWVLGGGSFE